MGFEGEAAAAFHAAVVAAMVAAVADLQAGLVLLGVTVLQPSATKSARERGEVPGLTC